MNSRRWALLALAVIVVAVVVAGRLLLTDEAPVSAAAAPSATASRPDGLASALPPAGPVAPAPAGSDTPLPPMPESTVDAAESMKQANEHGDPAAPPVVRDSVQREAPTPAELADPKAYQRYEARQNQRLYNEYVKAANTEIPRLQADIERARAAGLPPEQIAEGEEKLRRIQAMKEQLQSTQGATPAL